MEYQKIITRILKNLSYEQVINDYVLLMDSTVSAWKSSDLKLEELATELGIGVPTLKYRLKTKAFKPNDLLEFYNALYRLTDDHDKNSPKK